MIVISRTPLRLELLGGSTDIASFYRHHIGYTLNVTLDKYIHVVVKSSPGRGIRFIHETIEDVSDSKKLLHARTRAVLQSFGLKSGLEVVSLSDLSYSGSGLGSSSAYVVGLVNACAGLVKKRMTKRQLAETACNIEITALKEPIGKQDQYSCSFGGCNFTAYAKGSGRTSIRRIKMNPRALKEFESHLLIFKTGAAHSTRDILSRQGKRAETNFSYIRDMALLVPKAKQELERGNLKRFAEYLSEEWTIKKNLLEGITTPRIDAMLHSAHKAGAWGGRVSGAGGGGFVFVLAPKSKHGAVRQALRNSEELAFSFDDEGSTIRLITQ